MFHPDIIFVLLCICNARTLLCSLHRYDIVSMVQIIAFFCLVRYFSWKSAFIYASVGY